MLVIKVFVNRKQIDELQIQNVLQAGEDTCGYVITKPEKVGEMILHKRSNGYKPLLKEALDVLIKKEKKEKKKDESRE
jgi:hypothetical protein